MGGRLELTAAAPGATFRLTLPEASRVSALDSFCSRAAAAGRFGIDTEFVGEGRYRTLLCLIQLVVSDDESLEVLVLDALDEHVDLAPLAALLADPALEVVMHAGRQDVALLRRDLHTEVTRIFDTQVAAGFAGLAAQAGYDTLLREVIGVRVQKTASYTRWDRRPLDDEQLAYAREDVLHLLELAPGAGAPAGGERPPRVGAGGVPRARAGRGHARRRRDLRTPAAGQLAVGRRARGRARARALARGARRAPGPARHDRPQRRRAGRDRQALAAHSRRAGADPGGQPGQPAPPRRGAARDDRACRDASADPLRGLPPRAGGPTDGPQIALAEAFVRSRALEAGLAYELIATRADLAAAVASVRTRRPAPDVRTLRGWRHEVVGADLLALLRGERSVAVGADGRLSVSSVD